MYAMCMDGWMDGWMLMGFDGLEGNGFLMGAREQADYSFSPNRKPIRM